MQFKSLLSLWPPAHVWDNVLNPSATEFLPYCHLIGEGGTLEGIHNKAAERFSSILGRFSSSLAHEVPRETAEEALMRIKGLTTKPNRWYATYKSDPPEREEDGYDDSCCILQDSPDLQGQVPFATSVLYGFNTNKVEQRHEEAVSQTVSQTKNYNAVPKPLNALATSWTPNRLFHKPKTAQESKVHQLKKTKRFGQITSNSENELKKLRIS
jgi:hypothetical protein